MDMADVSNKHHKASIAFSANQSNCLMEKTVWMQKVIGGYQPVSCKDNIQVVWNPRWLKKKKILKQLWHCWEWEWKWGTRHQKRWRSFHPLWMRGVSPGRSQRYHSMWALIIEKGGCHQSPVRQFFQPSILRTIEEVRGYGVLCSSYHLGFLKINRIEKYMWYNLLGTTKEKIFIRARESQWGGWEELPLETILLCWFYLFSIMGMQQTIRDQRSVGEHFQYLRKQVKKVAKFLMELVWLKDVHMIPFRILGDKKIHLLIPLPREEILRIKDNLLPEMD